MGVDDGGDAVESGLLDTCGSSKGTRWNGTPNRSVSSPSDHVVADDGGDLTGQLAALGPSEQVDEAVAFPADQEDDPLWRAGVGESPLGIGVELVGGHGGEPRPQLVDAAGDRVGAHRLPGEEPVGVGVGVIGSLGDPGPRVGEEARDARDDAGLVRAAEGQDVAAISGGDVRFHGPSVPSWAA